MYDNYDDDFDIDESWLEEMEAIADELEKQRNEKAKQLDELRKQTEIEKENTAKAKQKTARMHKKANEHFSDDQVSRILKNDFNEQKKLEREKEKILKEKNRAMNKAVGGAFGKTGKAVSSVLDIGKISPTAAKITGATVALTALVTAAVEVTRATAKYNQELSTSMSRLGGASTDSSDLTESMRGISASFQELTAALGDSKLGDGIAKIIGFVDTLIERATDVVTTSELLTDDNKRNKSALEQRFEALGNEYGRSTYTIASMYDALKFGIADKGIGAENVDKLANVFLDKILMYGKQHEGVDVSRMAAEYASMISGGSGTSRYSGVAVDDRILYAKAAEEGKLLDTYSEKSKGRLIVETMLEQTNMALDGQVDKLGDVQAAWRNYGEMIKEASKNLFGFDEVINVAAKDFDSSESALGSYMNNLDKELKSEEVKKQTKQQLEIWIKTEKEKQDKRFEERTGFKGKESNNNDFYDKLSGSPNIKENTIPAMDDFINKQHEIDNTFTSLNNGIKSTEIITGTLLTNLTGDQKSIKEKLADISNSVNTHLKKIKRYFVKRLESTLEGIKEILVALGIVDSEQKPAKDIIDNGVREGKTPEELDKDLKENLGYKPGEKTTTEKALDLAGGKEKFNQKLYDKSLAYREWWNKNHSMQPNVTSGKHRTAGEQKFAVGGVVTAPTTALIGEAGREAVIPLENSGGIEYLKNALIEAGAGNDGSTTVNVTLSGQILEMNDYNVNKLANRIGAAIDNYTNRRGGINYTK